MATASTIEELVVSIAGNDVPPSKLRRLKAQFARGIRHHSFGRTNQFEVEERLIGLEEKYLVLGHDDVSIALRQRRLELQQHQQQWVPDVLDFLLHMSRLRESLSNLEVSDVAGTQDVTVPRLKWSDLEKHDPINRQDRMWRQPTFSDLSSDNDSLDSNLNTTPESKSTRNREQTDNIFTPEWVQPVSTSQTVKIPQLTLHSVTTAEQSLTEADIMRETLFMLQGHPTAFFSRINGHIARQVSLRSEQIPGRTLDSILARFITVSKAAASVRNWSSSEHAAPFMRTLEDSVKSVVISFDDLCSKRQQVILRARLNGGVCSILEMSETIQQEAAPLLAVANFLSLDKDCDPVSSLDILLDLICKHEQIGNATEFRALSTVFIVTFNVFMAPLSSWIVSGILPAEDVSFFVHRTPDYDKARLWHSWFSVHVQGPKRLPRFLLPLADRMFVAGKTSAFVRTLKPDDLEVSRTGDITNWHLATTKDGLHQDLLPFAAMITTKLEEHIDQQLTKSTTVLRNILEKHCRLQQTLTALSHLYLSGSPHTTSIIDAGMFERLDRGSSSWSDRFIIRDIIEEACGDMACVEIGRVSVQSQSMTSEELVTARTTVQVLSGVAIEYSLPWPVANIIAADVIASYRRVSLMLSQIRRAKYVLERHGYQKIQRLATSRKVAEATHANLSLFINTLYAHLMHCVVGPMTARMQMHLKGTVDEMITIFKTYTSALERSCLLTKNLKMVRETLVSLLNLCVGFGFQAAKIGTAMEPSSIDVVRVQFRKLVTLFVAGLRGAARAGAARSVNGNKVDAHLPGVGDNVGDLMDLLANSLEHAQFKT